MVSLRKAILLLLDVACTVLTLMTGLQENPILVSLTGRYDLIRSRFDQGKINYNIVRDDLVDVTKLPQPETVSSSYRFITAPERSPSNLGEDRSTCMRVNSMSASVLAIQFDDFFGKGARREQVFLYSISAPNCNVINFKGEWLADCIDSQFAGNATECYQYIFDNFDALLMKRQLQVGVEKDFGAPGRPFLKCLGRANKAFEYITDLLVLQSYWAGDSYHIEIQSSTCNAAPVVRDKDWQWGLFVVEAATKSAKVVCAMQESSWVTSAVSLLFGIVSLIMIFRGIFVTLSLDNLVKYVPRQARVPYFAPFRFPMAAFNTYAFPPKRKSDIVISRGQRFFASDMWMNHWLYIALSISDAVLRVRTTYVVLEMGAWMLKKQRNFENFLFVCTALTRLTWITCFVHTLARYSLKILLKVLKKLRRVTRLPYDATGWFIDASALFLSYKVYVVLISTILYGMLQTRGTTSFMTRQAQPTAPVFGGFADIANFWCNEIVCDLGITCAIVLVVGHFLTSVLLCTRYKTLARNRLLRLLQDRYLFVGWDVFVAIEALGIDPSDKQLVQNGAAMTNCSFSSLLQQLYASGPSGLVEFAGDSVFLLDQTGDQAANDSVFAPIILRYPPLDAQSMGLCTLGALQRKQTSPLDEFGDSIKLAERSFVGRLDQVMPHAKSSPQMLGATFSSSAWGSITRLRRAALDGSKITSKCGIPAPPLPPQCFGDRKLHIHSDSRWGRIVLVDFEHAPGTLVCTQDSAMLEFVVQDALSLLRPRSRSCGRALAPAAARARRFPLAQEAAAAHFRRVIQKSMATTRTPRSGGDGGGGSGSQPTTNVFALCELAVLEWRVYGADTANSHEGALHALSSNSSDPSAAANGEDDALHALFRRLQQQKLLTVKEEEDADGEDASSGGARVWLFVVNNGSQDFPTADTLGDVIEVGSGTWTRNQYPQQPLDAALETRLFRALHALFVRKLLVNSEFVLENEFFQPNDAKFVYRCPSLSQLNHFDIYLDEDLPCPAFQLHFQLLVPSHLVCVSVAMFMKDKSAWRVGEELGDPQSSWQRLLGLPCASDHSMVDVWHLEDGLVPRIIAETKYSDVYPRFRSVTKRKHKRKSDEGDGNDGDDAKKTEENDDEGEDEDEEAAHDAEGDGDDLIRRATPGKKKRKKISTDPAENDESVAPVSPDTHVNTPDATGPTVRVTFPHDPVDDVLHYDAQVSHFKRKRIPSKKKKKDTPLADLALVFGSVGGGRAGVKADVAPRRSSVTEYANMLKANAATPALALLQARRNSLLGPGLGNTAPRSEVKPTLSVAVSLVASLSHDEQQEALDGRPTKTHPLLEALQNYVETELNTNMEEKSRRAVSSKHLLLPNAEEYVSAGTKRPPTLLGVNAAISERLRNNLLAEKFKAWISDYSPHQHLKKTKQSRKERQRKVLLEFDESKLLQYTRERSVALSQNQDQFKFRDEEIALGVQMAASDALVAWRDVPRVHNRWSQHKNPGMRVATKREKQELADRVQPHLMALRSFLRKGGNFTELWLSFNEFAKQTNDGDNSVDIGAQPAPPKFCVSTVDFSFNVEPPLISEYLLRGFHPVAAPKPVDYAIVCPHSPSEWLGILALSYLTCFRSMYAQCHMGDHAAIDLAQVEANSNVSVDASNALLLVECASSPYDAFATYRSAGELLNPVLSNGVKKKQAFSRSAVANVIYVVVPFRRQDVKHKMWALGAFCHGLFGSTSVADVAWKDSVTIELLYLEDLYEVGVNPSPFALMPSCFGLYDRVFENVSLKPAEVDQVAPAAPQGGKSRFVSERLYHLADAASKPDEKSVSPIYGGYAISEDRKWIACSCVDTVGSVLETYMIRFDVTNLEGAFLEMMTKWLNFLALIGEKASLVICRLGDSNDAIDDQELTAWRNLSENRQDELLPAAFAPLIAGIKILQVSFMPSERVQVREDDTSILCGFDKSGYLVVSPNERAGEGSRGACYASGGSCNMGSSCFPLNQRGDKEAAVVSVSIVLDQIVANSEGEQGALSSADDMQQILNNFHALSYLTMHPITTERASPLPLHLAVIDKLNQDTSRLAVQLQTDPLQFR